MARFDFITTQPYWKKITTIPTVQPVQPWTLADLPPLLVGDNFAFQVDPGFDAWVVQWNNAVSWHWALAGLELPADQYGPADRQIVGSLQKGIATELLSTYGHRGMRIYRPKLPSGVQESLTNALLKRYAYYGAYTYNFIQVYEAPADYLLRAQGIQIPTPQGNRFYCLQFCAQVWADMGYPLYDASKGTVTQADLENSPMLEKIWGNY